MTSFVAGPHRLTFPSRSPVSWEISADVGSLRVPMGRPFLGSLTGESLTVRSVWGSICCQSMFKGGNTGCTLQPWMNSTTGIGSHAGFDESKANGNDAKWNNPIKSPPRHLQPPEGAFLHDFRVDEFQC
ncbi:hypothetical protein LIPSTDRAFT_74543 [Lipomyces starkeyi NRRL Y-11557]|uniref:Uncharacterized protein n=1 Tax=Lipomyces starkeyi NRRL Y-11557 TaxID=675824 RepID=A0A1E3PZF4_LIPST|nr:hypothetical protein LIPSTDRAFT_74543 [Lipomyces starkeyi NRRL Y-11557]